MTSLLKASLIAFAVTFFFVGMIVGGKNHAAKAALTPVEQCRADYRAKAAAHAYVLGLDRDEEDFLAKDAVRNCK